VKGPAIIEVDRLTQMVQFGHSMLTSGQRSSGQMDRYIVTGLHGQLCQRGLLGFDLWRGIFKTLTKSKPCLIMLCSVIAWPVLSFLWDKDGER